MEVNPQNVQNQEQDKSLLDGNQKYLADADNAVRWAFIRKVYAILTVQLVVTCVVGYQVSGGFGGRFGEVVRGWWQAAQLQRAV